MKQKKKSMAIQNFWKDMATIVKVKTYSSRVVMNEFINRIVTAKESLNDIFK